MIIPDDDLKLSHPKYRPDIDGLRGIAVLGVLIFHAFPAWFPGGFIGVDIFFVISGYLISLIIFENLDRGSFSFQEFYIRRIRRIFPSLIIVLLTTFALGWFILLADEYKQLGKHIASGAAFIPNIIFWKEAGYFDGSSDTKPLLHLWSLGIEEQFYIIWPLLLWISWRRNLNVLTMIIIVMVTSFYLNIKNIKLDLNNSFYAPQSRFWELLAGALLAWLCLYYENNFTKFKRICEDFLTSILFNKEYNSGKKNFADIISVVGFITIAYGFWRISSELGFPGKWALIPVVGTVLIISAGPTALINRTILSNKVIVWFGLISYPLYLWHWPLLSFGRIIDGKTPSISIRIGIVLISILLAWLTYNLIENYFQKASQGKIKAIALVTLMVIAGYLGYNTYIRDGLAFRFPKQVRYLTDAIDFKWTEYVQFEQCHLQSINSIRHADICFQSKRPLIGLWGDSHASALYPGLEAVQNNKKFGIVQLTQAGCPPILDFNENPESPYCKAINADVMRHFEKIQPDIILIHSVWIYSKYHLKPADLYRRLTLTIAEIKKRAPKTKIIILGPVPHWKDTPQKMAYAYWKDMPIKTKLIPDYLPAYSPAYIPGYLGSEVGTENFYEIDDVLAKVAVETNSEFISLLQILCHDNNCLWKVGDKPEDILTVDRAHLSKSGSIFLVKKIAGSIIKD